MVAVTILAFIISIVVSQVNFSDRTVSNLATSMKSSFSQIELAFVTYANDKNQYPTMTTNGLSDTTFVPIYLYVPPMTQNFDSDGANYVNGWMLKERTGQSAPNNGVYICAKATVSGATDSKFRAIKQLATDLPSGKYFYNSACPATSNAADPGGSTTLYPTYWITRY